ncbi:carbon-nitrogen family hydrolase [Micromonospora sp. NPDC047707]|uniref:carbon-nitrogen family hydrolase n=1 Tax=Micromonospora sp. NPDC047707 TaxID=3154498 RepID=UPI00345209CD
MAGQGQPVMKIALIQLASPIEEPVVERVGRVGAMLDTLDDVDLVVLPELWAPGYFAFDRYDELAETLDGPLLSEISGWARRLGCHVQAGSILEREAAGRLYNTALLVGPDGGVLLDYRKMHVFGYESLEATLLSAGDRADVCATALGRIGMTTCYDLRFPELYRVLVDRGAQLVIVPAAWPAARLAHWQLFTRARAVENQVYVLACNAAGIQGDVVLGGHSVIVDPWGQVVAEAGADEQILYAVVDLQAVVDTRAEFPVLEDRKLAVPFAFD